MEFCDIPTGDWRTVDGKKEKEELTKGKSKEYIARLIHQYKRNQNVKKASRKCRNSKKAISIQTEQETRQLHEEKKQLIVCRLQLFHEIEMYKKLTYYHYISIYK